jgi:glycerol-3-phosphate dehydrogenase
MGSLVRGENLSRVHDDATWDVVVIGGGATGLGAAVDAAARGYRTLLLEAHDFAQATSSRSTKLIHGGVRYLAQGNVHLVREALHERGILFRNAPHLVHELDFIVPAYRYYDLPYYGMGLKVYDWLSGRYGLKRSRWLARDDVIGRLPAIKTQGLRGGVVYTDGQFDDARLAITLARTFVDLGGAALNYAPVSGLLKNGGRVAGVAVQDSETGEQLTIKSRVVVNACGVFVDAVRRFDDAAAPPVVTPSQGAHLVLERAFLPGTTAMLVPRTDDGRVLFAVPWHDRVLVGTTDTPVNEVTVEPRPLTEEVAYMLDYAARYLKRAPTPADILSTFAGLRPLFRARVRRATAKLSREHAVIVSDSGLVTITGGKWTTYRRMAIDTIDQAVRVACLPVRPSPTAALRLHGWREPTASPASSFAIYGSDAASLAALCDERAEWNQLLHPSLPYRTGEVIWAARHEAARTVEDVLARRTRGLFLDARASVKAATLTAALLARELGHDSAWQEGQICAFEKLAQRYLPAL